MRSPSKLLNRLGYGRSASGLSLNLAHNPVGTFLPPKQEAMEAQFKKELRTRHGEDSTISIRSPTCPIQPLPEFLVESGNYEGYMERLANAFNPAAAAGVMCRYTLSVGWDGTLYDCDFNQMLDLPVKNEPPSNIRDFDLARLQERQIITGFLCISTPAHRVLEDILST